MVKRPRITDSITKASPKISCLLHYHFAHTEAISFSVEELTELIPTFPQRIIEMAVPLLEKAGDIESTTHKEFGSSYQGYHITQLGISKVEGWSNEAYDLVSEGILFHDFGTGNSTTQQTWSSLPLEREGKVYDAAVSKAEAALDEIRSNNGFSEAKPEERDQIVWSLTEGLKQIKEGLPSRDQVQSMLVKPFSYIAEKFAGAALGEAAKAAAKALLEWIKNA